MGRASPRNGGIPEICRGNMGMEEREVSLKILSICWCLRIRELLITCLEPPSCGVLLSWSIFLTFLIIFYLKFFLELCRSLSLVSWSLLRVLHTRLGWTCLRGPRGEEGEACAPQGSTRWWADWSFMIKSLRVFLNRVRGGWRLSLYWPRDNKGRGGVGGGDDLVCVILN